MCEKCKQNTKSVSTTVKCNAFCGAAYHAECIEISSNEARIVNAKKCKNIIYCCDVCMERLETASTQSEKSLGLIEDKIEKLANIISTQTVLLQKQNEDLKSYIEMVDELKQEVKKMKEKSTKNTYVQITYNKQEEVVLIQPKTNQSSETTREICKAITKPVELKVGVTGIWNLQKGGRAIKCSSSNEVKKIENEAKKALGQDYNVRVPPLYQPCIKIVGMKEKIEDELVLHCLKSQNKDSIGENSVVKVLKNRKIREGKVIAVVEMDPESFRKIIKVGKVNIEWQRYKVYEHLNIVRCFKCKGFNHYADHCNDDSSCLKSASSSHQADKCTEDTLKCSNCIKVNARLGMYLDTIHNVMDNTCPVYRRQLENYKTKIQYSK